MESVSRKLAKITRPTNFCPLTNYSLLITTTGAWGSVEVKALPY